MTAPDVQAAKEPCETCDGDGYLDIVDDWGGAIGTAPCPNCSPDDPLEAIDAAAAPSPADRLVDPDGIAAWNAEAEEGVRRLENKRPSA